jgi:hypothetical protein
VAVVMYILAAVGFGLNIKMLWNELYEWLPSRLASSAQGTDADIALNNLNGRIKLAQQFCIFINVSNELEYLVGQIFNIGKGVDRRFYCFVACVCNMRSAVLAYYYFVRYYRVLTR